MPPSSIGDSSEAGLRPDRSPTVVVQVNEEGEREIEDQRWWKKVADLEEAKVQFLYLLPVIITNVSYHLIPVVSVMFAGHLGDLQLASSVLAFSWATSTGFAFMVGLSGALETLCGQAYGAQLYSLMGTYLQASCVLTLFFSILISIFWFYSAPILILLHQDHQVSKSAALYMKFLIPGLFAYGFLQNILRFLQAQSVVVPLVFCSVLPLVAHFGVVYTLVHLTPLGFKGAALAASISLWIAVITLGGYVLLVKKFRRSCILSSLVSLSHVFDVLKLALPSAVMVCLEYWAFELLVVLAGLMPQSAISTSLLAMCVNTEAIAYMVIYALSLAASTRVSNELGAGNPDRAKHAMGVTLALSLFLLLIVVLALAFGHNVWASFFSDSSTIIKDYASLSHFVIVSIILESITGVLSGVSRACGWQKIAMFINLGTFYCIGMPISIFLGFKQKQYARGLWLGVICGLFCQAIGFLLLIRCSKWTRIEFIEEAVAIPKGTGSGPVASQSVLSSARARLRSAEHWINGSDLVSWN